MANQSDELYLKLGFILYSDDNEEGWFLKIDYSFLQNGKIGKYLVKSSGSRFQKCFGYKLHHSEWVNWLRRRRYQRRSCRRHG